jgi:hypothetical protein
MAKYGKIPSTFRLGGRLWTVKRVGQKKWYGKTDPTACEIELSSRCKDDEELWHTFIHELMHAVAWVMGRHSFHDDEAKIDGVAGLLLQVIATAE